MKSTAIIGSAICTAVMKNIPNAVTSTSVRRRRRPDWSPTGRKWKVRSRPPMTSRWPPVANSSIVASIWWNLPKTVFMFSAERVEALGEREAAEDVDQAAGGRDRREQQVGHEAHRGADQHLGDRR